MTLRVAILCCVLGPLAAAAKTNQYSIWIQRLADVDATVNARAARVLTRAGTPALSSLRRAIRDAAENDPVRMRLASVIRGIERAEPHGLKFSLHVPRCRIGVKLINSSRCSVTIAVKNRGEKPVVLWPYFRMRVLLAGGNELQPRSRCHRRQVGETPDNFLEDVPWITLAPGETWSVRASLRCYAYDPDMFVRWSIEEGKYILECTYDYSLVEALDFLDLTDKDVFDRGQPWNQAVELKHTFRTAMQVYQSEMSIKGRLPSGRH